MALGKTLLKAILEAALTEIDAGEEPEQVIQQLVTVLGGHPQVYTPPVTVDPADTRSPRDWPQPGEVIPAQPLPTGVRALEGGHSVRPSDVPGPGEPPVGGGHILNWEDPEERRAAAASQKGGEAAAMPCAAPGCDKNVPSSQDLPYCPQHMPKNNLLGIE